MPLRKWQSRPHSLVNPTSLLWSLQGLHDFFHRATSYANHAVVSSIKTPPRRKLYPSGTKSKNTTQ